MARKIAIDDIGYDWYTERDNAEVSAQYPDIGGEILFQAQDQDVHDLIEDGFLKWKNDSSLYEYMIHLGIIEAPGPKGPLEYFYTEENNPYADDDDDYDYEGDED